MQEEIYSRHNSMPVAHVGTMGEGEVSSLDLKATFEGQENSSSGFRRTSLPPLPSPRLAQHEAFGDRLAPPTTPILTSPFLASVSTTDLSTTSTKSLLSPLQRRASVRQTRSTVNMRFSISSSSSVPSPMGADLTPHSYKNSRNSSPSVPFVEHKPLPSRSSQGRKNQWLSSLSQSPLVDRLTSKSPRTLFSANSTPPLTQTQSWTPLTPPPPQAPFLEHGKTSSSPLRERVRNGFESSRKQNIPEKINTNLGQIYSKDPEDEDLGMVSFFSPISSDEDERIWPPRKAWTGEGLIAGTGFKQVGGKATRSLTSGGKDIGDVVKRDKKDKRESREGRRRVSGFGTAHFRKFWGGKDDAVQSELRSPGTQASLTMPLPTPLPSFLNKVTDRATSPSPFSRKKDKQEKKPKESKKERRMSKGKDINPLGSDLRGKISNPIPHRDLLDAFPESPQYTSSTHPRDSSLLYSTPPPLSPPIPHSRPPSSPKYPGWLSSGTSAPPMANPTSSPMRNNRPSSSLEEQQSPLINLSNQYSVPLPFPPSPPYTSGERNLRPLSGHVRSMSAQNTDQNPPQHSAVYRYSNVAIATSSGSKSSTSNILIQRQEHSPEQPRPYSPGSAQDLLNILHKSLTTVERVYNHTLTSISRELSFDDRLTQELEAVEKRLKSQTEIVAGIRWQVEERRKRRESNLRRGMEIEVMALQNEGWGRTEIDSYSRSSEEKVGLGGERGPDEIGEQGVNIRGSADSRGDLINLDEGVSELPHQDEARVIIKSSSYTDLQNTPSPVHDNENLFNDYSSSTILPAIDRSHTDVEINAANPVRPFSSSRIDSPFTRISGVPPLPHRASAPVASQRPMLLSRHTFGEEQQGHAATGLYMTLKSEADSCSGPAISMTSLQRHSYAQPQSLVGLGIVNSNHYIPTPTEGLQSSTSSFSFESSDVEKVAIQEISREIPERHSRCWERGKDGKVIHPLLPRVEEKPGIYYHRNNGSSNTINTTATGNSNYHNFHEPSQPLEKPTSGHIHFPTPRSTNNSRNNSRANTPIHFASSPPGSSHGRHYRTKVKEEVARERAISPEGVLMRSSRSGIMIPPVQERKAVVDGVELMLI